MRIFLLTICIPVEYHYILQMPLQTLSNKKEIILLLMQNIGEEKKVTLIPYARRLMKQYLVHTFPDEVGTGLWFFSSATMLHVSSFSIQSANAPQIICMFSNY